MKQNKTIPEGRNIAYLLRCKARGDVVPGFVVLPTVCLWNHVRFPKFFFVRTGPGKLLHAGEAFACVNFLKS